MWWACWERVYNVAVSRTGSVVHTSSNLQMNIGPAEHVNLQTNYVAAVHREGVFSQSTPLHMMRFFLYICRIFLQTQIKAIFDKVKLMYDICSLLSSVLRTNISFSATFILALISVKLFVSIEKHLTPQLFFFFVGGN